MMMIIISITNFLILVGSTCPYLLHNWPMIIWVCDWIPVRDAYVICMSINYVHFNGFL